MSKGNNVIVQNSKDFAKVAGEKMLTTVVMHIDQDEIDAVNG